MGPTNKDHRVLCYNSVCMCLKARKKDKNSLIDIELTKAFKKNTKNVMNAKKLVY